MNSDTSPNKHPKYGNGVGYHRRSNGRKRKFIDKAKDLYSYENPSRCSKMSGVFKRNGRLVWYSYHNKWFRTYSDRVLRSKPLLQIPDGSWFKKVFDYSCACW